MSRAETNRAAAVYHSLVALLLLLLGGGLLALGIWLHVSGMAAPLDLEFTNVSLVNAALGARVSLLVLGGIFIVTALASLIALGRRCVGKTFRVIYILLGVIVFALLTATATLTWIVYARRETATVRDFLRNAWKRTVAEKSDIICKIEYTFGCRSFEDPFCLNEQCAPCGPKTVPAPGCYLVIIQDLRKVFLPLAIVATVMAVLVLIDLFVVCAL